MEAATAMIARKKAAKAIITTRTAADVAIAIKELTD
jgi:hypothetical protein